MVDGQPVYFKRDDPETCDEYYDPKCLFPSARLFTWNARKWCVPLAALVKRARITVFVAKLVLQMLTAHLQKIISSFDTVLYNNPSNILPDTVLLLKILSRC
jgi:hypothetical protein